MRLPNPGIGLEELVKVEAVERKQEPGFEGLELTAIRTFGVSSRRAIGSSSFHDNPPPDKEARYGE